MKCKKNNFGLSAALFLATLFFCFVTLPQELFPQSSFFQGKTITIIQGRDPGGTGDLRVRALVPFLQKHIPGNPTIVNEYMPGGGSRKAAKPSLSISAR
jgi:tripartite-type tricarboxylate transporter receptor subunit TctC